jgi:hypothetical protein
MRVPAAGAAVGLLALAVTAGCSNPLGRQYEYEEQLYLGVDGSATVIVNASIPALVALHGLPIGGAPRTADREHIRTILESVGCRDVRIGQPWVRRGRRFVQIRLNVDNVGELSACGPLAWSTYSFERDDSKVRYEQVVGMPTSGPVGQVNWNGQELVGFKLHAPSRIFFHNVKRLHPDMGADADRPAQRSAAAHGSPDGR